MAKQTVIKSQVRSVKLASYQISCVGKTAYVQKKWIDHLYLTNSNIIDQCTVTHSSQKGATTDTVHLWDMESTTTVRSVNAAFRKGVRRGLGMKSRDSLQDIGIWELCEANTPVVVPPPTSRTVTPNPTLLVLFVVMIKMASTTLANILLFIIVILHCSCTFAF